MKVHLRAFAVSCGVVAALAASPADAWSQARGLIYKKVLDATTPGAGAFANPTVVTFAPDGRLFVAQRNGKIFAATLDWGYNVTPGSVVEINTIYSLGTTTPPGRLVTGMTFGPGGDLFVSHSDVRQDDPAIPITSGQVTRLYAATGFSTYTHVATGLPRSQHDHASNGLSFKPGTNLLYLAQGGMTNAGSPDLTTPYTYDDTPETSLSGTVLEIDVVSLTTTVYARGFRNPYDLTWHSNGNLYLNDNGANANSGPQPDPSTCLPNYSLRPATQDELNLVLPGQFYGHPNPGQGYCTLNGPGTEFPIHYYGWNTSSNGIAEYTSAKIPTLKGKLLTANFATNEIVSVDPTSATLPTTLWTFPVTPPTPPTLPLDVAVNPAGGGIFVAEFLTSAISVLRVKPAAPVDFNGDGRSDVGVMGYATPFNWQWRDSATGTLTTIGPWGGGAQVPFAIDYDGDGQAGIATWNPSSATWHVNGVGAFPMGVTTDLPIAGDIDGDGRTDIGVMRPSTGMWYLRATATGATVTWGPYGGGSQVPFLVDAHGGGAARPATWDPTTATFHVSGYGSFVLGSPGDTPVVGDVDNDGRTDFAAHDPSTGLWQIRSTATGIVSPLGPHGTGSMVPFLLDFNGDGQARPAVYNPSTGLWHLWNVGAFAVGVPGDVPIRPAF